MNIVGIDIGTTSICGTLTDSKSGKLLKSVTLDNNAFIKSEAWEKIQSAERIESIATEILRELVNAETSAIGITGQMHGIVYLDRDGRTVSPLYTWQDKRGELLSDSGKTYAELLGVASGCGLVTDYVNREKGLVPKQATSICTIHDMLAMRLCGLSRPVMHTSDAASLGFFDVAKNRFTVDNPLLPEFTGEMKILGNYKNIPVTVAIGDNQASFIGSGCGNSDGDVLVNVGTGSQVSMMTHDPSPIAGNGQHGLEVRPLYGDKYLIVGCSLCGGRAFAALADFFCDVVRTATGFECERPYAEMCKCAEALWEKNSQTAVFDTRFCGTRENPEIRGKIENLSLENFTVGELSLACLCGITDELYGFYKNSGKMCLRLVGSGNGIRKNPLLVRIFEQRFCRPLTVPIHLEEAAYGASVFADMAVSRA